jgi:hypothetical protein
MVEIPKCDICGVLLSIEEAEKNSVSKFKFCNRHMDMIRTIAFLIRENKL